MNTAVRSLALAIVALFLGSLASGMMGELYQSPLPVLEEEPVVQESHGTHATSPGHVVFGQYISTIAATAPSKAAGLTPTTR